MEKTRPLSDYSEAKTAHAFGLSPVTLRQYATLGLLHPILVGDTRFYSERDRIRLAVVQKALRLGFVMPEITVLLDTAPVEEAAKTAVEPGALFSSPWSEAVGLSRALIARSKRATRETLEHAAILRAAIDAQRAILRKTARGDGLWASRA